MNKILGLFAAPLLFLLLLTSPAFAQVPPPVSITTTSLPTGTIGTAVSETLQASGGVAPYTWSASNLPTGLTIDPSTGTISGTPTMLAGTWNWPISSDHVFTAQVQDSVGQIATTTIDWTITPTITYTRTPSGGSPLRNPAVITIHVGPGSSICPTLFTRNYGEVGPWQGISTTGDTTITLTAGNYNDLMAFCTTFGNSDHLESLTVSSLPTITTNPLLQPGITGQSYSTTLQYSLSAGWNTVPVPPYTWSITSGTLPDGLSLNPSTGVISGTPTSAATSTFTVQIQDGIGQTDTKVMTMYITSAASLAITTTSLPTGTIGTAVSETLQASGGVGAYTWSATTPLPYGVTLDPSGAISGTPQMLYSSWSFPLQTDYSFTAQVQDSVGQIATATIAWTITPTITYTRIPSGPGPVPYPTTIHIHVGPGSSICSILSSDAHYPLASLSSGDQDITLLPGTYTNLQALCSAYDQHILDPGTFTVASAPTITTNPLLQPGIVGQSYSATLQYSLNSGIWGTVPEAPYTWTVTSGALPDGLSLDPSTGVLSGTPTAAATSTFTVQVEDAIGQTNSVAFTLTTLAAQSLPSITTTSLPTGTIGTAVSETLQASGGVGAYTWSATTPLPYGVTLDPSGAISGTPQMLYSSWSFPLQTDYSFTAQVQDSVGQIATATIAWTITPTITYTRIPSGPGPVPYPTTIHIHVGPGSSICSILSSDAHYPLASLSSGDQDITLLPGTYTNLQALCSAYDQHILDPGTFTVASAPTITTNPLLQPGIVGQSYSATLQYSLNSGIWGTVPEAPYTWTVTSGALPDGLSLDPSTGVLSGTPTAAATSTFTVQVEDAIGQTSAVTFTLLTFYPPVVIITSSLPAGTVGAAYSQTLQATSGTPPYTWGVTAGALPVGMSLSPAGTISGTPTIPGLYTFTVEAVDAHVQLATQTLAITVNPAPAITTTSLPQGSVNEAYSQTILTTGGTQPFVWSITAGVLPPGLSLDPSAGTISGTPSVNGTYHFTVRLADAYSVSVSKALDISVNPALDINTNALPHGKVGNPYSKTMVAIGGIKPYTWSVSSGSLPPGLALDPATGIVSGTPTSAGTYSVGIQVADANAQATSSAYTLKITSLDITTATLPKGVVGAAYTKNLAATGGTTPYTWSLISDNLPPGLTLDPSGALTGTPTAAGAFTFTVQVSDVNGEIDTSTYTATTTQTSIVTGALPNGKVGNAYSKTLVANSGTAPYAWSIIGGALPAGLSLSADGVISGTPTTAGTASVTVQVTDINGILDSQIYGLKVNP